MKRFLSVLLILLAVLQVDAQTFFLTISNHARIVDFQSSYGMPPYYWHLRFTHAHFVSMFPDLDLGYMDGSRSGGSIGEMNENRLERFGTPYWASGSQAIAIVREDGNGGYSTNQMLAQLTNTFKAPGLMFYTNKDTPAAYYTNFWAAGGWGATNNITFVGCGVIPDNKADGTVNYKLNDEMLTNYFYQSGFAAISRWGPLNFVGGWSNSVNHVGGEPDYVHWLPLDHPGNAGQVTMYINDVISLSKQIRNFETNVWDCMADWSSVSVVSTNHCAMASLSKSGSVLTFSLRLDRMAGGFDVPDGTITNDCRDGFLMAPWMGNAIQEIIRITNAPDGLYTIAYGGTNVWTDVPASQLAAGLNNFTNYTGPLWAKKVKILKDICEQEGADPVTLLTHSAGDQGPRGIDHVNFDSNSSQYILTQQTNHGDAYITLMKPFTDNIRTNYDNVIHADAQQTPFTVTVTLQPPPPPPKPPRVRIGHN